MHENEPLEDDTGMCCMVQRELSCYDIEGGQDRKTVRVACMTDGCKTVRWEVAEDLEFPLWVFVLLA